MAREHNFLLGKGELLTDPVSVSKSGGEKNPPYKFAKAKKRISEKLKNTTDRLAAVPSAACPGDEVVALMTIHPRYVAKSDFPIKLLNTVGLRAIGTRPKKIKPESWGIKEHPKEAVAEQIFVAGKKSSFNSWLNRLPSWNERTPGALLLTQVEDLAPFEAKDKLRSIPNDVEQVVLEVVLHNQGRSRIVDEFEAYAQQIGANPLLHRIKTIGGLTFIPVRAPRDKSQSIADFAFVRVARGMPAIRPLPEGMTRSSQQFAVAFPEAGPLTSDIRAVIFDGGLPESVDLKRWITYIEAVGVGNPIPRFVQHGLGVTSALLFGPLESGKPLRQPFCPVDHVRVLGAEQGADSDLEYVNVLDRILKHLDQNPKTYQFISLSLGPDFSVEDDDVNLWTSSVDQRLSHDQVLAAIAAGNSGEKDAKLLLNRIQPPSDAVNALSVGACDTTKKKWKRASYSSVGPGRSPGFVKPDGVTFGGSDDEPFMVLDASPKPRAVPIQGTSFAAPFALSGCIGTKALAGQDLSPLAVRALLIHRAETFSNHRHEVGWGLLLTDPRQIMTCEDHETLVVYQGILPIGQHLRANLPVPSGSISGKVLLRATLIIAPEVDPEHPAAYTKGGLEVAFRPNSQKFKKVRAGEKPPLHQKTVPFFSGSKMHKGAEFRLREEGFKWEPCLRHEASMFGRSLSEPCFDIWYHHRDGAAKAENPKPLPYALVVTLSAPKEPDFYNRVVRTYSQILVPVRPKIEIPISNKT